MVKNIEKMIKLENLRQWSQLTGVDSSCLKYSKQSLNYNLKNIIMKEELEAWIIKKKYVKEYKNWIPFLHNELNGMSVIVYVNVNPQSLEREHVLILHLPKDSTQNPYFFQYFKSEVVKYIKISQ